MTVSLSHTNDCINDTANKGDHTTISSSNISSSEFGCVSHTQGKVNSKVCAAGMIKKKVNSQLSAMSMAFARTFAVLCSIN